MDVRRDAVNDEKHELLYTVHICLCSHLMQFRPDIPLGPGMAV
jgi:hypothetical protein